MTITRVPSYSPEAIAEHAVGLLMCLNRKYIKASQRIRELNFTLNGLQGYTLAGKTVGVIGAGHIGICFIKIMLGMGCKVLVYDLNANPEVEKLPNCQYTDLDTLLINSDVVSLHCPLNESTKHIINKDSLEKMKDTAYLINTGRGGLINTTDLIQIIKAKKIGGVGLDVYEYEENIFFHDLSDQGLSDDTLARLLTFPNVIITSHQAFFTYEALNNIAKNSMQNVAAFLSKQVIDPLYVILPIS